MIKKIEYFEYYHHIRNNPSITKSIYRKKFIPTTYMDYENKF